MAKVIYGVTPQDPSASGGIGSARAVPVIGANGEPVKHRYYRDARDNFRSAGLSCLVGEDGVPRIEVRNSPSPPLNQEAIAALAQWRFEPARLNGDPIAVFTTVELDFRPLRVPPAK